MGADCALWPASDGLVAIDLTRSVDRDKVSRMVAREGAVSLEEWVLERRARGAATMLAEEGIPATVVADVAMAAGDPQLWWRGMFAAVSEEDYGGVIVTGSPLRVDERTNAVRALAPKPGRDTEAVLRELGCEVPRGVHGS
jgi:crotonobetainyl-CoA:carnitine CoA-transferase CaiB-like acyl-CoA transferase